MELSMPQRHRPKRSEQQPSEQHTNVTLRVDRIRTVLIDGKRSSRVSLQTALGTFPEIEIVGSFGDGLQMLESISAQPALPWDVVLMAIASASRTGGLRMMRELKEALPTTPIVVLSADEDPEVVLEAICAGATGYVHKETLPHDLVRHLKVAATGGSPLSPGAVGAMLEVIRRHHGEGPTIKIALSRREQQVLEKLVSGCSYKQVGNELGIGIETVRTYIRSLYKKLQVHSVAEAVSTALRFRLVQTQTSASSNPMIM